MWIFLVMSNQCKTYSSWWALELQKLDRIECSAQKESLHSSLWGAQRVWAVVELQQGISAAPSSGTGRWTQRDQSTDGNSDGLDEQFPVPVLYMESLGSTLWKGNVLCGAQIWVILGSWGTGWPTVKRLFMLLLNGFDDLLLEVSVLLSWPLLCLLYPEIEETILKWRNSDAQNKHFTQEILNFDLHYFTVQNSMEKNDIFMSQKVLRQYWNIQVLTASCQLPEFET